MLHMGFAGGKRRPRGIFLKTPAKKTVQATSFTWSAEALGLTIPEGSLLVLSATTEAPGANRNFNGCTVDGNAASPVAVSPSGRSPVGIYQYVVPAGGLVSPTIAFSINGGNGGGCTLDLFNLVGLQSNTAVGTFVNASVVSVAPNTNLAISDDGIAIGVGLNNVSGSAAWTGLDVGYRSSYGIRRLPRRSGGEHTGDIRRLCSILQPGAHGGSELALEVFQSFR